MNKYITADGIDQVRITDFSSFESDQNLKSPSNVPNGTARHIRLATKDGRALLSSETPSPFAAYYKELLSCGYTPLPIMPGGKMPGVLEGTFDWQGFENSGPALKFEQLYGTLPKQGQAKPKGLVGWESITRDELLTHNSPMERKYRHQYAAAPLTGVGVRLGEHGGGLVAIDVDAFDPDVVEAVRGAIDDHLTGDEAYVSRRGGKGFAQFFRLDKGYEPPSKLVVKSYGIEQPVEILAHGQAVIPPSIHPDDKAYEWLPNSEKLWNVELCDLPVLDSELVEAIFAAMQQCGDVVERVAHKQVKAERVARTISNDDSIWARVNNAALADLDAWVPHLNLYGLESRKSGYAAVATWRASGTGRDLGERKRNLSITCDGIIDFGTARGFSAVDLVAAAKDFSNADALVWLMDKLGLANDELPAFEGFLEPDNDNDFDFSEDLPPFDGFDVTKSDDDTIPLLAPRAQIKNDTVSLEEARADLPGQFRFDVLPRVEAFVATRDKVRDLDAKIDAARKKFKAIEKYRFVTDADEDRHFSLIQSLTARIQKIIDDEGNHKISLITPQQGMGKTRTAALEFFANETGFKAAIFQHTNAMNDEFYDTVKDIKKDAAQQLVKYRGPNKSDPRYDTPETLAEGQRIYEDLGVDLTIKDKFEEDGEPKKRQITNCMNPKLNVALGLEVSVSSLCEVKDGDGVVIERCPFKDVCGQKFLESQLSKKDTNIVAPMAAGGVRHAAIKDESSPDMLIYDESIIGEGLKDAVCFTVEDFKKVPGWTNFYDLDLSQSDFGEDYLRALRVSKAICLAAEGSYERERAVRGKNGDKSNYLKEQGLKVALLDITADDARGAARYHNKQARNAEALLCDMGSTFRSDERLKLYKKRKDRHRARGAIMYEVVRCISHRVEESGRLRVFMGKGALTLKLADFRIADHRFLENGLPVLMNGTPEPDEILQKIFFNDLRTDKRLFNGFHRVSVPPVARAAGVTVIQYPDAPSSANRLGLVELRRARVAGETPSSKGERNRRDLLKFVNSIAAREESRVVIIAHAELATWLKSQELPENVDFLSYGRLAGTNKFEDFTDAIMIGHSDLGDDATLYQMDSLLGEQIKDRGQHRVKRQLLTASGETKVIDSWAYNDELTESYAQWRCESDTSQGIERLRLSIQKEHERRVHILNRSDTGIVLDEIGDWGATMDRVRDENLKRRLLAKALEHGITINLEVMGCLGAPEIALQLKNIGTSWLEEKIELMRDGKRCSPLLYKFNIRGNIFYRPSLNSTRFRSVDTPKWSVFYHAPASTSEVKCQLEALTGKKIEIENTLSEHFDRRVVAITFRDILAYRNELAGTERKAKTTAANITIPTNYIVYKYKTIDEATGKPKRGAWGRVAIKSSTQDIKAAIEAEFSIRVADYRAENALD